MWRNGGGVECGCERRTDGGESVSYLAIVVFSSGVNCQSLTTVELPGS
jgi:hypothetical protein